MDISEILKIVLVKRGDISRAALAKKLNTSPQNLYNKFARNNFNVHDLELIADALDCELKIQFIDKESGNVVY